MSASQFDVTTRLLIAFAAFMMGTTGLLGYLAISDPQNGRATRQPSASGDPDKIPCDPRSLDSKQCPSGLDCVNGFCEEIPIREFCGKGAACGVNVCACEPGLVCYLGKCWQDPPPAHKTCLDPKVQEAMVQLTKKCNDEADARGQIMSATACTPDDWRKLALKGVDFDLLMSAFPDRFSVHFELGVPTPGHPRFKLGEQERLHYMKQMARQLRALRDAKQIVVIGRASADGDQQKNYKLAMRRLDIVQQMIRQVLRSRGDEQPVPLRAFSLAAESEFQPERFRAHYATTMMTWDPASASRLERLLKPDVDFGALPERDKEWLDGMINRVVLVIPIPCDGTEWIPAQKVK